jgi:rubrerythrin
MPERALLREDFQRMLQTAQTAAQEYEQLGLQAVDPQMQEQFQRLAREKYRHVELAQRLLEIVTE